MPDPQKVVIAVKACGICRSELFEWTGARQVFPRRLGHEATGEVVAVGHQVTRFKRGDRVTGIFLESLAEYAKADQDVVAKVPDSLSFHEAALGEPLLCAVSGAVRTDVALGKLVAVIGTGFMGLLAVQLLRLKGAHTLVAVDNRPEALAWAKWAGADETFSPKETPVRYLLQEPGGTGGVDISVECTGNNESLDLAIRMLDYHGLLSIVGFHQGGSRSVDVEMLNWKAASIINAHEKRNTVRRTCLEIGMKLAAKGQINLDRLITHCYPFEDVDRAFYDLETRRGGYVKGVVDI